MITGAAGEAAAAPKRIHVELHQQMRRKNCRKKMFWSFNARFTLLYFLDVAQFEGEKLTRRGRIHDKMLLMVDVAQAEPRRPRGVKRNSQKVKTAF